MHILQTLHILHILRKLCSDLGPINVKGIGIVKMHPPLHISIDRELGARLYPAPAMTVRSWDLSIAAIPLPEDPRTPGGDKYLD